MRAAINTPIQGSAADVATAAMLSIDACQELKELGWKMLLQVLLLSLYSFYQMIISQVHQGSYSPLSPKYLLSALAPCCVLCCSSSCILHHSCM